MKIILIVLSLCFAIGVNCQRGVYPDSGVFVSLNSNFLMKYGDDFTSTVQNKINSDVLSDISGKSGKISYTISKIHQSIKLGDITYLQTGANTYNIGWSSVDFTITTDYNGCYKIKEDEDLSFCEHGTIEIKSTASLSLITSITLDFNKPTPTIVCTGTTLSPTSSISYNAHCTSKVCAKTSDIRKAVEQEFVPKVESTITNEINENSDKYLPLFPTLRDLNLKLNDSELYLDSKGSLVESASNTFMTLALQGGVVVKESNGNYVYPTQSPSSLPSYKELELFNTDVAITLTSFFLESIFDAGLNSKLPMTITPNQLPSDSVIKLNTSDPFFSESAPGLTEKYPNKPIDVTIELPATPISVSINSTGALLIIDLPLDFKVDTIDVFQIVFQFFIEIKPALKQVGNDITITGIIEKWVSYAKVTSSEVGDVDTTGFLQVVQLVEGLIKVPTFTLKNPLTKYTLSDLSLLNGDQFIQIFGNLQQSLHSQYLYKFKTN